jgi:hypothetical protein
MDPKTIAFGLAVVAASVGGSALVTDTKTQELTVKAGATADDELVAAVAKLSPEVKPVQCVKLWANSGEGTEDKLVWSCADAVLPATEQAAMDKKAGADAVAYRQEPRIDGETVTYDVTITRGAEPVKPPVVEPKPVVEEPLEVKEP